MIKVDNKFARHGMFWTWTLPILVLLLLPAFINAETFRIKTEEFDFFRNSLGRDVEAITSTTNAWFKSWFVDTGAYSAVNNFFKGGRTMFGHTGALERASTGVSSNYASALWMMIYRFAWRVVALLPVVWEIFLCLTIPALIDGLCEREKKTYQFKLQNPVYFWTASHTFIGVLGFGFFLPLTPMDMSQIFIIGFAVVLSMMAWITASNFQTGGN